jgi:hypothetical protein
MARTRDTAIIALMQRGCVKARPNGMTEKKWKRLKDELRRTYAHPEGRARIQKWSSCLRNEIKEQFMEWKADMDSRAAPAAPAAPAEQLEQAGQA